MVFDDGSYTIVVGEPGTDRVETFSGVVSVGDPDAVIEVFLD
jgi:hypothetical protein